MILLSLLLAAAPGPAAASTPSVTTTAQRLQSLNTFLAGAKNFAVDNREALAQAAQQTADSYIIMGHALPSLNAKGVYTYNQYPAEINIPPGLPPQFADLFGTGGKPVTIIARNQLDAYFTANVPLIDVGTWVRGAGVSAAVNAIDESVAARQLDVQKQVVRTYYQLVASEALIDSANRNQKVAEDNLQLVRARKEGGVASDLDVERAVAQVENAKQNVASAILSVELAGRSLHTLSGIEPGHGGGSLADDLHDEPPLEDWRRAVDRNLIPSLRSAAFNTVAARRNAYGSYILAFAPTIVGQAQEHVSNVTGFTGKNQSYALSLTANWTLDFTSFFTARDAEASWELAQAHEDRARYAAEDGIHQSWFQVRAQIAKSKAALAESAASQHAAEIARDRYQGGAATQLDVLQAERDAFTADVSRIQAQADLSYSRAELRINAGQSIAGASEGVK